VVLIETVYFEKRKAPARAAGKGRSAPRIESKKPISG
jgi:hypothetical protein